jgi:hypothetical protein
MAVLLWIAFWQFSGVMLRARDDQGIILLIIGSFALLTISSAVAALVMSVKAVRRIRSNPALKGAAMARIGGTLGSLYLLLIIVLMATPGLVPARRTSSKNACINNLRQLDGAKEQWALEHKKTATDTPTWHDLIGTDKYIRYPLACDKKGTYTINSMSRKPTCSVASHTLP